MQERVDIVLFIRAVDIVDIAFVATANTPLIISIIIIANGTGNPCRRVLFKSAPGRLQTTVPVHVLGDLSRPRTHLQRPAARERLSGCYDGCLALVCSHVNNRPRAVLHRHLRRLRIAWGAYPGDRR
ncbi:hypothetical protein F5Y10DRAFT_263090 [Nemania abortiva]|nr:hypothetical protein F5Y10DRAFT_263090 [Nemania abortiva]